MNAGDRVAMTLHDGFEDREVMCVAVPGARPSTLMLMTEDGECIATITQFWRKTSPMLGQESKHVKTLTGGKPSGKSTSIKCCEAPGCGNTYYAKKADLARGWGKTCSKSCAAKLRESKR
jgi:hypothetical protein